MQPPEPVARQRMNPAGELPVGKDAPPGIGQDPEGDYDRIARAIEFLRRHPAKRPSLAEVARAVHLSERPCQRLFSRWAGLSPERFLQVLTLDVAKTRLAASADVLSAAHDRGLSEGGRRHDPLVELGAMTPGECQRAGAGLEIRYGQAACPFGRCLVGATPRGVCFLEFLDQEDADTLGKRMEAKWPGARFLHDEGFADRLARRIFTRERRDAPPPVLVRGTHFQTRVWSALRRIPPGRAATYAQVAEWIGQPRATRAVGGAVGANPVAWLIPCHRVLRSDGQPGGYAWGVTRKLACLAWETPAAAPEP
ncbi:MAG: methylated-DNA--[protein]-cysteine S-methyltransferase [Verrucomicrobiota bacterium]